MKRGVLQGDPLSPYLFNICLDWALSGLSSDVGAELGGHRLTYLAFADDVALLANTRVGLQRNLDSLSGEARRIGLSLGVRKCATLGILANKKRKTWAQDSKRFTLNESRIKSLTPGTFYKYLGIKLGAGSGATAFEIFKDLAAKLRVMQRAPAKPQQKLWGLSKVLLPQLLYPLVNAASGKGQLRRGDREVRRFVRSALHLPKDTPTGYFHTACAEGGLGVPALETLIPRLRADLRQRLLSSGDRVVRLAVETGGTEPEEPSPQQRRRGERGYWSRRLYEAVDGRGLEGCHHTPASSAWVGDGSLLLKGKDFVQGVKLRGNLLNTKVRSARGRQAEEINCDLCGRMPETLGHIEQRCGVLQEARIHRHDRIVSFALAKLTAAGFQTTREPAIPTTAGTRCPDIIAWGEAKGAWVLDAQVVADAAAGSLHQAHLRKMAYYAGNPDVVEYARSLTGHPPVFSTITASWRGVLEPATQNTWTAMGLRTSDLKLLAVRVVEGGCMIYREFRRTSGSARPHPG